MAALAPITWQEWQDLVQKTVDETPTGVAVTLRRWIRGTPILVGLNPWVLVSPAPIEVEQTVFGN